MGKIVKIKRALVSVSDKDGLDELVKYLDEQGVEIIASGGTAKYLELLGIKAVPIEQVTGNPEAFGGRMKTLSFQVASALLYRREHEGDITHAQKLGINPIDLVICNLYPFDQVMKRDNVDIDELIENIDIGGPTMIRAAAKNYKHVTICSTPSEYSELLNHLRENDGQTRIELRKKFAVTTFQVMGRYDSLVAAELEYRFGYDDRTINLSPLSSEVLRYGENPHQRAYLYRDVTTVGVTQAVVHQGKELSYNNFLDADAAWRCTFDLMRLENQDFPAAVTVIKHSNPCGAAIAKTPFDALKMAWDGDPVSSFGSIICFNQTVDDECAQWLTERFVEVILAPGYSTGAKEIFGKKKNLRILEVGFEETLREELMLRRISGGWLVQNEDVGQDETLEQKTEKAFPDEKMPLAQFGITCCKHLKSNAIVLVKSGDKGFSIVGAGMGNPNRLVSLDQAVSKARENKEGNLSEAILVSDAFFPFSDNIELAQKEGIRYIVQPGGSIKDQEVIDTANKYEMGMIFTGRRHFRH